MSTYLNVNAIKDGSITADKLIDGTITSQKLDETLLNLINDENTQEELDKRNVGAVDTNESIDNVDDLIPNGSITEQKLSSNLYAYIQNKADISYVNEKLGDIDSVLESIINGGGTSLITFTINGIEYKAEQGMTWVDWNDADVGLSFPDGLVYMHRQYPLLYPTNDYVYATDEIQAIRYQYAFGDPTSL